MYAYIRTCMISFSDAWRYLFFKKKSRKNFENLWSLQNFHPPWWFSKPPSYILGISLIPSAVSIYQRDAPVICVTIHMLETALVKPVQACWWFKPPSACFSSSPWKIGPLITIFNLGAVLVKAPSVRSQTKAPAFFKKSGVQKEFSVWELPNLHADIALRWVLFHSFA